MGENKKIGHITFHNSTNYGAVLQTIALQKTIQKLGYDTEIIDYVCLSKVDMYKDINFSSNNSIKVNIREILNYPFRRIKNRKARDFMKNEYEITSKVYKNSNEMSELNEKYDAVVCGSDQIWNYKNTKFDKAYFLDFVNEDKKKISYAASFGIDKIENNYKEDYKALFNQIENLSVREESAKILVKEISDKDAEVVVDPTLLFDKSDWLEFRKKRKESGYILVYSVKGPKEIYDYAHNLSVQTGKKVVVIYSSFKDIVKYKAKIPDPKGYIELINNADYVITDSFHGVAFSINLNKEFYTFLGKTFSNNSRLENILKITGLESRILRDGDKIELLSKIDYSKVNKIIQNKREQSLEFLKTALENASR